MEYIGRKETPKNCLNNMFYRGMMPQFIPCEKDTSRVPEFSANQIIEANALIWQALDEFYNEEHMVKE